ncbi:hypothetical protein C5167_043972 [Papaver somniferum]|uniref:Uncharacterized protein n=1 Tax=Papaver somniferum TaxID=3469 RepID=A0A4Y7L8V0_PAPSO|nr:hypothetical protein C5167_043972 [Papaver somniferum]
MKGLEEKSCGGGSNFYRHRALDRFGLDKIRQKTKERLNIRFKMIWKLLAMIANKHRIMMENQVRRAKIKCQTMWSLD